MNEPLPLASPHGEIAIEPGSALTTARRQMTRAFAEAGIESPDLDARILLAHALGHDLPAPAADDRALTPAEAAHLSAYGARRLRREPVALIVGEKEFWSLPLRVTADTLVPRPETETVVEAALAALPPDVRDKPLRIADLGTGTGAILLALLNELPQAFGVGIDISAPALAVARGNAERLGFGRRCAFVIGDFASALGGGFDLIVSNPPYVASGDLTELPPEVREHEPRRALDGGADGLAAYRSIATEAGRLVGSAGRIVLEIGWGRETDVVSLFGQAGLTHLGPARRDLSGTARALVFARQ